ncbi:MAG: sugar phosphate isomerase/epimerase [Anaerolineaceae bacterium]|nr:sugar phosphate isomerase/epimerase [Anaerolineaceae bacterium]
MLSFRIGTSSYIIPDDILPNVHYLAGKVSDVELVLFELDDGPSNLPGPDLIRELIRAAQEHNLSYTVHLPLDLRLGADGDEQHVSLLKARRVIEATRALQPWAYVLHLDGKEVRQNPAPGDLLRWQDQSVRALEITAGWAGSPDRLAVENLESYPLDFLDPVLARIPVSRCVDIGHLWMDGHDPIPFLEKALPRTRVIHIHGISGRDHKSLAHVSPEKLDPVLRFLVEKQYSGVMTLEIFSEEDFKSSLDAVAGSLSRNA